MLGHVALFCAVARSAAIVSSRRPARRMLRAVPETFGDVLPSAVQSDVLQSAISGDGFVSAKVVDCTTTVAEMCSLQSCLPLAATALGRAVTCVLLIADGIEEEEVFQVRFDGDGPLRGVFATSNGRLEARGYVGNPKFGGDALEIAGGVARGVGQGSMQIVRLKNLPGEEFSVPMSSVVDIISGEIAEDINHYVATSEQREGALSAGVVMSPEGTVARAAGWRLDLLPDAPEEVANALVANVKGLLERKVSMSDMLQQGSSCEDVLRLLLDGLEPKIFPEIRKPSFKCQCGMDRVYRTLALLPRHEVMEIVETNDTIEVRCEFCCRQYSLSPTEITDHLEKLDADALVDSDKKD